MSTLCLYHKNCTDGLGAAYAVREYLSRQGRLEGAKFQSVQYGDVAPDVTDMDVYIVDFSWPRDVLLEMHKQAKSLIVGKIIQIRKEIDIVPATNKPKISHAIIYLPNGHTSRPLCFFSMRP